MAAAVTAQEHRASILSLDGQTLDLESTLFSGQVFRWRKRESWYEGVVSGRIVRLREVEGGIAFTATGYETDVVASQLRDYFSLGFDLSDVHSTLSRDSYLRAIIDRYRGMRGAAARPLGDDALFPVRSELECAADHAEYRRHVPVIWQSHVLR